MEHARHVYRFGPFCLDAGDRLLYRENQFVPLPPKVLDTLLLLVSGGGRVVTKADLMKQLWPDTFVEEGTLTQYISVLRKSLGEDANWIETLPRRGYRFTAPVEDFRAPEEPQKNAPEDQNPARALVIDPNVVAKKSHTSRLRAAILICLLLALTGVAATAWQFRRGPSTGRSSKGEVESRLALAQNTLYHSGRAGSDTLRAAISNANRALSMNADSPAAVRAVVHIQHNTGRPIEGLLLARRALDSHPDDLDAIAAAAEAYFRTGVYDRAVELYRKALEIEPDNRSFREQIARIHLFKGEYQKGLDAIAALPVSEVGPFGMLLFLEAGQKNRAIEAAKSFSHSSFSAYIGGCVLDRAGDRAGAIALWQEGVKITLDLLSRNENPHPRMGLAKLYAKLGIRDRAVEQLDRALAPDRHHPISLFFAAQVRALLGDRREAVELLTEAMENGFVNVFMLDYHQRPGMAFHNVHSDPELRALRAEMARRVEELRRVY